MKKYQNVTQTTLAIDCYNRTIYIRPGEMRVLPNTRDVSHYFKVKSLVLIRDRKESKVTVAKFQKPKKFKKSKRVSKDQDEQIINKDGE